MNVNQLASLLGLLFAMAAPSVPAETPEPLTVAVLDFESKDEGVRDLGPKLAGLLTAELSRLPDVITVERADIEKVLGEQELGLSGTVSAASAARVGHLTGAKVLITGRVFKAEREVLATAKVIGTETGRVYGELAKASPNEALTQLSTELAAKLAAVLKEKAQTLVAKVQTRSERVAAIRSQIKQAVLPTVSVAIQERHYGQPAIDPAAQTELCLLLTECGFKVVDAVTTKPDVAITGEAFSAFGLRKGNLYACKARIELKAEDHRRKAITVDRETSVAADIAEQTAGKTALENATLSLAARLLPKLVQ